MKSRRGTQLENETDEQKMLYLGKLKALSRIAHTHTPSYTICSAWNSAGTGDARGKRAKMSQAIGARRKRCHKHRTKSRANDKQQLGQMIGMVFALMHSLTFIVERRAPDNSGIYPGVYRH